jgi:hypothetical protein
MGWTLLAFHSIYVSSGIEYPLSFLIPFYYYFKLLVLGATFVLPTLTALNPFQKFTGESSGSNPFIVGWFNFLVVPTVQRMHELMDHDPKRWAVQQLSILPFFLLDYFILPGVLLSDEERDDVRMRRSQSCRARDTEMEEVLPAPSAPPASIFERDNISTKNEAEKYSNSSDSDAEVDSNQQSNLYQSPIRPQRTANINTPEPAAPTSFFPRTTPISSSSASNLNITSPVAKSRVASSALKLRRFSREHEVSQTLTPTGKLTPRVQKPAKSDRSTAEKNAEDATVDKEETKQKSRYSLSPDENEAPNRVETITPKRKRRGRLSLGDRFRELVTGDANIRVRDHLFDLDLPTVPICPSPRRHPSPRSYRITRSTSAAKRAAYAGGRKSEVDASNITTRSRRSSRIKKH